MNLRILSRYILKEVALYFGISLFAFTAMLLTLNMLKFASLIINKGVGVSQIMLVFMTLIPTFLEIALPMSALLGVMLAFARLSGDSELIVMRASGISLLKLVIPVVIFGVCVSVASGFVSLIGRPWGYEKLSQTLFEIASSASTAGLDEGVFTKLGHMTVYASSVDHTTGKLQKVLLDDRRDPTLRKIVISRRGQIVTDNETQRILFLLEEGEIHEQSQGKYSVTRFSTNSTGLDPQELYSDDGSRKGRQFSSMSLAELETIRIAYAQILERLKAGEVIKNDAVEIPFGQRLLEHQMNTKELKKRVNRTKVEFGRRFSMPYASFVLALVGMALGIQPPRTQKTWGAGLSALFGMSVFVIYYGFLSIGMALAESNQLHPYAALWIPNTVVTILAVITLYRLGKEQWHSVTQAVDDVVRNLRFKWARRRA